MAKTKTRVSASPVQTASARRIRCTKQVQQQPGRSAESLRDRTNPNTPAWARQKQLAAAAAATAGTKAGHAAPHAHVTVYLLEPPLDPPAAAAAALSAAFCCFNRMISASLRHNRTKRDGATIKARVTRMREEQQRRDDQQTLQASVNQRHAEGARKAR